MLKNHGIQFGFVLIEILCASTFCLPPSVEILQKKSFLIGTNRIVNAQPYVPHSRQQCFDAHTPKNRLCALINLNCQTACLCLCVYCFFRLQLS